MITTVTPPALLPVSSGYVITAENTNAPTTDNLDTTQRINMETIPVALEAAPVAMETAPVAMETAPVAMEATSVIVDSQIGTDTGKGTGPSQRPETVAITSPVPVPISPPAPSLIDNHTTTNLTAMQTCAEHNNNASAGSDGNVVVSDDITVPSSA
jgi:hypothetical protein